MALARHPHLLRMHLGATDPSVLLSLCFLPCLAASRAEAAARVEALRSRLSVSPHTLLP
jgi:hypothetical protein